MYIGFCFSFLVKITSLEDTNFKFEKLVSLRLCHHKGVMDKDDFSFLPFIQSLMFSSFGQGSYRIIYIYWTDLRVTVSFESY